MTTRANFYVDQGTDFQVVLDLLDAAGSGYEVNSQQFKCEVKRIYSSTLAFEAVIEINLDDNDTNNINLIIPAATTRSIEPGKYQYDLIMFQSGKVVKILEGLLFLLPSITSSEV
jgi:hypothetical protein